MKAVHAVPEMRWGQVTKQVVSRWHERSRMREDSCEFVVLNSSLNRRSLPGQRIDFDHEWARIHTNPGGRMQALVMYEGALGTQIFTRDS